MVAGGRGQVPGARAKEIVWSRRDYRNSLVCFRSFPVPGP